MTVGSVDMSWGLIPLSIHFQLLSPLVNSTPSRGQSIGSKSRDPGKVTGHRNESHWNLRDVSMKKSPRTEATGYGASIIAGQ
jgi:hypothetical protein